MAEGIPKYVASSLIEPLRQGEILSSLIQIPLDPEQIDYDDPKVKHIVHPLAIIVSQDCDLDWDFKARQSQELAQRHKLLPNVLLCEAMTAPELRGRADINRGIWNGIKTNKGERYHFLEKVSPDCDALGVGLDELGIDFKRYFTIPTVEVYFQLTSTKLDAARRCRLASPYLEHLSTRFAYFQARIALPEDHFSEPSS